MTAPGHIDFYVIVLFVHILAAIVAFGVVFAYPVIDQVVQGRDPRSLPLWHEAQVQVSRKVVTPAALLVLIAGVYMASDRWSDLSSGWWSGAFACLIVIVGIDHAIMNPLAKRMRDRAALDVQGGAGGGAVALSDEYRRMAGQRMAFGALMMLLVVAAVFLMVVKPGV